MKKMLSIYLYLTVKEYFQKENKFFHSILITHFINFSSLEN
jgi:hypothetical protein